MKKSTSSRDGDNPCRNSSRGKKIVRKKTAIEKELLAIEKELKEAEAELQRLEQPNAYKPKPSPQPRIQGKTYQFTLHSGNGSHTSSNNGSIGEAKRNCLTENSGTCRDEKISPIQSLCPKQKDETCHAAGKGTKTTKKQDVPTTFIELDVVKRTEASCQNDVDSLKCRITYLPSTDGSVKSLKIDLERQPSNSSSECKKGMNSEQNNVDTLKPRLKNCQIKNPSDSRSEKQIHKNRASDKKPKSVCQTSKIKQANGLSSCEPVVDDTKYEYIMSQTNSTNDCNGAVVKNACGSPNCVTQESSKTKAETISMFKDDITNGTCGSTSCLPLETSKTQHKKKINACPIENKKPVKTTYGVPKCKSPLNLTGQNNLSNAMCGPKPPFKNKQSVCVNETCDFINKTMDSKLKVSGKPNCENNQTTTTTTNCSVGKKTDPGKKCKIGSHLKNPSVNNNQSNIIDDNEPVDLCAAEYKCEPSDDDERDSCIMSRLPLCKDDLPDFSFYKQPLNNLINSYSNFGKRSLSNTDSCSWNTEKNKDKSEPCTMQDHAIVPGKSFTCRDSEYTERNKFNSCDTVEEGSAPNDVCYRHRAKNCSEPQCSNIDIVGRESLCPNKETLKTRGSQTKEGSECTVSKIKTPRKNVSVCSYCSKQSTEPYNKTKPTCVSCNGKSSKGDIIPCDAECLCDCHNQVLSDEVKNCTSI